jgi:hypothetical protein
MTVKNHIKSYCNFIYYRKGFLYYLTDDTAFMFRVPVEDTEDATFRANEKSLTMMRYIRKELESHALSKDG